tara:strand:- start:42 stop:497 length:456 start_codon:yes stop_codon:yes gene_type:complete
MITVSDKQMNIASVIIQRIFRGYICRLRLIFLSEYYVFDPTGWWWTKDEGFPTNTWVDHPDHLINRKRFNAMRITVGASLPVNVEDYNHESGRGLPMRVVSYREFGYFPSSPETVKRLIFEDSYFPCKGISVESLERSLIRVGKKRVRVGL